MTTTDFTSGDAVYATVRFADLLGLPIGLDRLHDSLIGAPLSLLETSMAVDELVAKGTLVRRDELVCLAGREAVFGDHVKAAKRAAETWPLAETWAKRVGQVPFVRMVAVTGPLAIDALGPDDPIDFFIVVRPRRLWITRSLIAKVIRSAAQKGIRITPAYITTTRAPEIGQHSVAMAWELAQLAVVVGESVNRTVRRSNDWMFNWLPNATLDGNPGHQVDQQPTSKQKWTETLLLLPPFRVIENWIRRSQVAQLRKAVRQELPDGPREHHERFSTEVCDEHLGTRTWLTEQAWTAALNDG